MQKTLGGDRLGSGKKMKVELHGYERSTHDMGYLWRSTMSAGTLVPFMKELALPGDTFDIDLDADIKTHPTVGPLFGSYKVQLDIFQAPIRLYQGLLHNNKIGIGMNMSAVPLPQMTLFAESTAGVQAAGGDIDNCQINPSSLLSYLDIRGIGYIATAPLGIAQRNFCALPLLAYWDIYKNYYANKQEVNGAMIFNTNTALLQNINTITIGGTLVPTGAGAIIPITGAELIEINFGPGAMSQPWQVIFNTDRGIMSLDQIGTFLPPAGPTDVEYRWKFYQTGNITVNGWRYILPTEIPQAAPNVFTFPLSRIDDMREEILRETLISTIFVVNDHATAGDPYWNILDWTLTGASPYTFSQQGLGIKTYQSDLFNNWLSTEFIDGVNGITALTAIDTTGGSFTIDTLNLSKKVYDMLNRIAVSGGSYDDWLDAVYTHDRYIRSETPIYHGGLIRELVFQEVVSNSEGSTTDGGSQPLGTLAGKGIMSGKKKGGKITVRVDEPSYIMGIISLTPRIDYSQGNKWDVHLLTMDDLHKPALDEIGFQELTTEQMAWWDTYSPDGAAYQQRSAGKQPAWINYMTNVNQVKGNFAIEDNEMFMTLNRRYEFLEDGTNSGMVDLTTYIDPVKYNHIFADTAIDAQNFWAQISVDITARRKMSAKIMPNL